MVNRQADGKQSLLRLLGDNLIGSAGNIAGESQKLADDKRADGQRQLLNEDASAVIDALAPTAGLQLVVFDDIREHGVRDEVADGDAEARDKCHDEEDADFARLQEHQTSLRNEPEAHSNKVNRLLSDLHAYPAPQWHEAESGCLHRQCQEVESGRRKLQPALGEKGQNSGRELHREPRTEVDSANQQKRLVAQHQVELLAQGQVGRQARLRSPDEAAERLLKSRSSRCR